MIACFALTFALTASCQDEVGPESFMQEYSDLKNQAIAMAFENVNSIGPTKTKIKNLLESPFLKQNPGHFSKQFLTALNSDLSVLENIGEAKFKHFREAFFNFGNKVFYEMVENRFKEDQKDLNKLQIEVAKNFKPFSTVHLRTEYVKIGALIEHNKKKDFSGIISKSQNAFEGSGWGQNPELHFFLDLQAMNYWGQADFKKQKEAALKEIEILEANFGKEEGRLLNPQSLALLANVELGDINQAKAIFSSIRPEYLKLETWASAKVLARIHKAAVVLFLKEKDYEKAKSSQKAVLNNLKLYMDDNDARLLREAVRFRDLLIKLEDTKELELLEKEYQFYPLIK